MALDANKFIITNGAPSGSKQTMQSSALGPSDVQAAPAEGAFVDGDKTKLDGIEALADVTDATNVDAAGAVMNTDTTTASMSFVVDEDDLVSNLDTKVPTQQSVKAYVDGKLIQEVATTATQFGVAKSAGDLVLVTGEPATLYRINASELSTDTIDSSDVSPISIDIAGKDTTAANLETNFPAADNNGRYGYVAGTTAANGLYYSDGASWIKQLDNSGDRTTLFDYAGGLSYSGNNDLSSQSGTVYWKQSDLTTNTAHGVITNCFDNNDVTENSGTDTMINTYLFKEFASEATFAMGRFRVVNGTQGPAQTFEVVGWDGAAMTTLTITSVTGDGTQSGNSVNMTGVNDEAIITTDNTTAYRGYGIKITAQFASSWHYMKEVQGQLVTDNTNTIDCVRSINKVAKGVLVGVADNTAATVNLEVTDEGYQPCDCTSNNVTCVLPAVADTDANTKIFVIKKTDSGANTVIIDGDGAETIDGAATQTLTEQYECMTIKCNGTEWEILSHHVPSVAALDSTTLQAEPAEGAFVDGDKTKLDGIETAADVTDATNVDAAGAVMNSDTSTASMSFVVDEDDMSSNSATKVPTQQSVKAYVDDEVVGNFYVSSASASNAITATTYLNVLANATIADTGVTSAEFTVDNTNKRLTYTGTRTRLFHIDASFSMTSSKSNEVSRYRLAKNGTTVAATEVDRKLGTGSDVGAASVSGVVSLATNDYIELHATLDSSTSDTITINFCNLSAFPI